MKRTVQKTLNGEDVNRQTTANQPQITIWDIVWLPIRYLISRATLQRLLFLLAFLTYGIGDGVTASYMLESRGVKYEINPIVRFMYVSGGGQGVIGIKIWFALMILVFVWIISRRTNSYWTINGFLSALCVGGAMAMRANLVVAYGIEEAPSPSSIIMTFLFLMVLFVMLGDMMDKLPAKKAPSNVE